MQEEVMTCLCSPNLLSNCSVVYGMLAQQAFSVIEFPLMWEWGESKSFDVATGPAQTMSSCHASNFAWGEH